MRGDVISIQVRKTKPELLDTRVRPEEWAEALELQLKSSGSEALDPPELPGEPLFSVTAQTSLAPPCPTPGAPSLSGLGTRPVLSRPPGRRPAPPPSAPSPLPAPLLPASLSCSPARGSAQRSAGSSRGCIADAAAAGCARAVQGAGARVRGAPGMRVSHADPTALRSQESAGWARGGSAGREHEALRPSCVARVSEEAFWGRGPGCCRRARNRPCPRADRGRPHGGPRGIWAGIEAAPSLGAVARRDLACGRPGPRGRGAALRPHPPGRARRRPARRRAAWAQFRRSPRAERLRAPHLLLPGSG